jgi:hypothetical protein
MLPCCLVALLLCFSGCGPTPTGAALIVTDTNGQQYAVTNCYGNNCYVYKIEK